MTLSPITFTRRSHDMVGTCFTAMNNLIEQGVNSSNENVLHSALEDLEQLSPDSFKRYKEEGSYYPAFRLALRQGHFQKVLEAIQVLEGYTKFQTPTIRLCKAACLHQLGRIEECALYLENPHAPELFEQLESLIPLCIQQEKDLYRGLHVFCYRLATQSD